MNTKHNTPCPDNVLHARQAYSFERSVPGIVPLVRRLCAELRKQSIAYCHWKSNAALHRSAAADNDLDLLVSRHHIQPFTTILSGLGFKRFHPPADQRLPGILDYYGYDAEYDKFVHVHAHYQLVLGHDATKNFHLPIEGAYLESTVQGELFRVPDPAFEYIILVLRMALKHFTWDLIFSRQGTLSSNERDELLYLQPLASKESILEILERHLPYITPNLFEVLVKSLEPVAPLYLRMMAGHRLLRALHPHARRSRFFDLSAKAWRRLVPGIRHRLFGYDPKMRTVSGGLLVAIVGGDGSGKTTAVDALQTWLWGNFESMRLHMGKPQWSFATLFVRAILKIGNILRLYPFERTADFNVLDRSAIRFPGYPWALREVCTARDRLLTYARARRFASNGGVAITDRFPLPQVRLMDGPQVERMTANHARNRLIRFLIRKESKYYSQISSPDLLIVLNTNPDITVQRKTTEDAPSVRARTMEIWNVEWERTIAHVVDGGRSKSEVLSDLKSLIWSHL